MSLMRLAQFRLESAREVDWWFRPPWNKHKDRSSVLYLEQLTRRHSGEIQRFLSEWLGDGVRSQKAVTKKEMSVMISELAEAKHLR